MKLIVALALTLGLLGGLADQAGADSQIDWVLDASGSVQCVVQDGTINHILCWAYPAGGLGPPGLVIDDWVPYGCLGGAYMASGDNAGNPAALVYRNVPGWYCGRGSGVDADFVVGTCWNGAAWHEGIFTYNPAHIIQIGNIYPTNQVGGQFPTSGCAQIGYSAVGALIYY